FFLTDPSTTYIYTLSLHDALPILSCCGLQNACGATWIFLHAPLPSVKRKVSHYLAGVRGVLTIGLRPLRRELQSSRPTALRKPRPQMPISRAAPKRNTASRLARSRRVQ